MTARIKRKGGPVSLGHMWYRRERVVEFLLDHYPDEASVTRELGHRKEAAMLRRWHCIRTGTYTWRGVNRPTHWVSLMVVDKLLTALGLHIWLIGEPDAISPRPPAEDQSALEEAA